MKGARIGYWSRTTVDGVLLLPGYASDLTSIGTDNRASSLMILLNSKFGVITFSK